MLFVFFLNLTVNFPLIHRYCNHMYFRIQEKKMRKSYVWASFLLPTNSTFLHISFPERQMTKARDFNFFHTKANKISYSLVHSLSITDKRE